MIEKIVKNLENGQLFFEDMKYLLFTDDDCINILYKKAADVHKKKHDAIELETKIFYPLVYSIQSNCPTCGYQTPESRREYNPAYMESVIKYNIDVIKSYDITRINCLHIDNNKNYERELFLKILNKYDIDKAIKIDDIKELDIIEKYDFASLIMDSKNLELFKYLKDNKSIQKSYHITANVEIYNNNLEENIEFINNLREYDVDAVEIVGYDPFYDDVHEYNPQYSKEYLKRVISTLRIMYPELELKISYATNGCNYFDEIIPLGINSINGIYCNRTNKLFNIERIRNILQKIPENQKK